MSSEFWERAAAFDPMWAVLSDPARRGRRWTASEFFGTGRREISLLMFQLSRLGQPPAGGAALDFGCGLGRVSQALAAHFDRVVGVDVSDRMVRLASVLNRFPTRVSYVLNQRPDLACLESKAFDFVYSDIVLQHIPPDQARAYIAEFIRVLRPGGIAVFQLPSTWRAPQERPTAPVPMPDAAYRALITPADDALPGLEPGATRDVVVEVRNGSTHDWDQRQAGVMRLGNHWLAADGAMLVQDDGRRDLPVHVPAGGSATLVLPVTSPPEPGSYLCEFDLVHEAVCWFGDRGSQTVRVPIVVGRSTAPGPAGAHSVEAETLAYPDIDDLLPPFDPDAEPGEFPMHGVPAEEVLALLKALGAECFFQEADDRGGPEWAGYRYFVRRTRD